MLFSLAGLRGVGKTTLYNNLRERYPHFIYLGTYERKKYLQQYKIPKPKDEVTYYCAQKIYMGFIFNILGSYNQEEKIIIMDRGPEYSEFYTKFYPIIKGYDWNVEANMHKELKELKNYKSDYILFLDAPEKILAKRRVYDEKNRRLKTGDEILNSQEMRNFFIKKARTRVINTGSLSEKEVLKLTIEWISKCIN